MFTTDCKDPNCFDCTDTSSAQSSEEGSESEILKTDAQNSAQFLTGVEDVIHEHLQFSLEEKLKWSIINKKLKDEVHSQIRELITVLRSREQELYMKIDQKYNEEVYKIDEQILFGAIQKLKKINVAPPSETIPQFTSDFEDLKSRLGSFGQLGGADVWEQPLEAAAPQTYLGTLTALCSQLSLTEEDEVAAMLEEKIYLKESKEKTVEPEKCIEKIESKENGKKKIKVCKKVSRESIPLIKIRKRGRPTPIFELRLPQKDLLKQDEVELIYGAKEKRSLKEKAADPKSSGKRSKKSVTQPEKKKKDAVEDRFDTLQKQRRRIDALKIKKPEENLYSKVESDDDGLNKQEEKDAQFLSELEKLTQLLKIKEPGRSNILGRKRPGPFQFPMEIMNTSDFEDAVQPIDLGEISFETISRVPEKLSSQVRRRIDALKIKKPEENLYSKVESDDNGLNKPEEKDAQLESEQENVLDKEMTKDSAMMPDAEHSEMELDEELRSKQELIRKHVDELGQVSNAIKSINQAKSREEYKRYHEEALRLFEGFKDEKIVNKACGFEESSEEDSSSVLDKEVMTKDSAMMPDPEQSEMEFAEKVRSKQEMIRKHIDELSQVAETVKGINQANWGEGYERYKEEAWRLFLRGEDFERYIEESLWLLEGLRTDGTLRDGKIVNKACGFEESGEEDSSSDLDMEIISRNEAASIPADVSMSPPLPPKNRFKFLLKRNTKPPPSSETSGIGESESAKMKESLSSTEVKERSPSAEQPGQEPKRRFQNPKPSCLSETEWKKMTEKSSSTEMKEYFTSTVQLGQEPKNQFKILIKRNHEPPYSSESESTQMKENSSSTEVKESSPSAKQPGQKPKRRFQLPKPFYVSETGWKKLTKKPSSTEMKENSSSTEQPGQESPKVVDVDPNPTLALRSSFMKFLEKNSESEWLATGEVLNPCCLCSSDKASPADNNQKEALNPEIYQWLH